MITVCIEVRFDGERKLTVEEHVRREADVAAALDRARDDMLALLARNHNGETNPKGTKE